MAEQEQDSSVNEMHGGHAEPLTLEHAGRTYQARLVDDDMLGKWERWLRQEARREALLTTGEPSAADRVVTEMGMAEAFRWMGAVCRSKICTASGQKAMACLIFGITPKEFDALMKARPSEVNAVVKQVMRESFPDLVPPEEGEDADPNGRAGGRTPAVPRSSSSASP